MMGRSSDENASGAAPELRWGPSKGTNGLINSQPGEQVRVVNDRRRLPRVAWTGPVAMETRRGEVGGVGLDMSADGMSVLAPQAAKARERVRVRVQLGDTGLQTEARVVRMTRRSDGFRWALRFDRMDHQTRATLEAFVRQQLASAARVRQAQLYAERLKRGNLPPPPVTGPASPGNPGSASLPQPTASQQPTPAPTPRPTPLPPLPRPIVATPPPIGPGSLPPLEAPRTRRPESAPAPAREIELPELQLDEPGDVLEVSEDDATSYIPYQAGDHHEEATLLGDGPLTPAEPEEQPVPEHLVAQTLTPGVIEIDDEAELSLEDIMEEVESEAARSATDLALPPPSEGEAAPVGLDDVLVLDAELGEDEDTHERARFGVGAVSEPPDDTAAALVGSPLDPSPSSSAFEASDDDLDELSLHDLGTTEQPDLEALATVSADEERREPRPPESASPEPATSTGPSPSRTIYPGDARPFDPFEPNPDAPVSTDEQRPMSGSGPRTPGDLPPPVGGLYTPASNPSLEAPSDAYATASFEPFPSPEEGLYPERTGEFREQQGNPRQRLAFLQQDDRSTHKLAESHDLFLGDIEGVTSGLTPTEYKRTVADDEVPDPDDQTRLSAEAATSIHGAPVPMEADPTGPVDVGPSEFTPPPRDVRDADEQQLSVDDLVFEGADGFESSVSAGPSKPGYPTYPDYGVVPDFDQPLSESKREPTPAQSGKTVVSSLQAYGLIPPPSDSAPPKPATPPGGFSVLPSFGGGGMTVASPDGRPLPAAGGHTVVATAEQVAAWRSAGMAGGPPTATSGSDTPPPDDERTVAYTPQPGTLPPAQPEQEAPLSDDVLTTMRPGPAVEGFASPAPAPSPELSGPSSSFAAEADEVGAKPPSHRRTLVEDALAELRKKTEEKRKKRGGVTPQPSVDREPKRRTRGRVEASDPEIAELYQAAMTDLKRSKD